MQSLPNASQYSLAGGTLDGGSGGEKYFGDDGYRGPDDSDKTPLRADFNTQPQLGYDQDTPLLVLATLPPPLSNEPPEIGF